MSLPNLPRWRIFVALLFVAGCLDPVEEKIDQSLCDLASLPRDPAPAAATLPKPTALAPPAPEGHERWSIPPDLLPGGEVPPLKLPPATRENEAKRADAVAELFPELGPLGEEPEPQPGPAGQPLDLAELQKLAAANSPSVKQALAAVEAAHGAAVQAGLYPNPTIGFEQDQANTSGGPGYIGGFVDQKIITGNKLELARAVASMEVRRAELALRAAQADLATRVRAGYFAVLVARENVRINKALAGFTAQIFRLQVDQIRSGLSAPYEPMQLRALAYQARGALIQARNRCTSAWKQLSSAMGLPGMPPTQLAGAVDMPAPLFHYDDVLARVLQSHTDVQTATVSLLRARYGLRLARITPIPDVDIRALLQKDYTGPPFDLTYSATVSMPLPVWDRNQGGIHQAQARVAEASEEGNRIRVDLTSRLAEAFERYQDNRELLKYYRDRILPDQARVYRGVYERWNKAPPSGPDTVPPGYTDVVVAQQNLAGSIATYVATLGSFWQAVVDVAGLLQTDDFFQTGTSMPTEPVAEAFNLEQLLAPPARPACAPQPGHAQKESANWPSAMPHEPATTSKPPTVQREPVPLKTLERQALPPENPSTEEKLRDIPVEEDKAAIAK